MENDKSNNETLNSIKTVDITEFDIYNYVRKHTLEVFRDTCEMKIYFTEQNNITI